jgi:hypothetical protein
VAKKQGCVNVSLWLPIELIEDVDAMTARTSAARDRVSRNGVIREACASTSALAKRRQPDGSIVRRR